MFYSFETESHRRIRPVVLTAITTILGLIPKVTGISYDFHHMAISWVSESSQWWRSMAVVVIFGLIVATFLTMVVVPTHFYLQKRFIEHTRSFWYWLHDKYRGVYDKLVVEQVKS